jgi:hypothetical protein
LQTRGKLPIIFALQTNPLQEQRTVVYWVDPSVLSRNRTYDDNDTFRFITSWRTKALLWPWRPFTTVAKLSCSKQTEWTVDYT